MTCISSFIITIIAVVFVSFAFIHLLPYFSSVRTRQTLIYSGAFATDYTLQRNI